MKQAIAPDDSASLVREKDMLSSMVPFSRTTLWRAVRDGKFPKPIRLTSGITAWRVSDIRAWVEARASQPVAGTRGGKREKRGAS